MDLKRTGFDQTVEFFDLLGAWLDIVVLDFDAGRRFWRRHHAVGIGQAAGDEERLPLPFLPFIPFARSD